MENESANLAEHPIPPVRLPYTLGEYWPQPNRSEIEVDRTHALMARRTFEQLFEYNDSRPSGTYAGKMWKSWYKADRWFLYWFGENDGGFITVNRREILIA